MEFAKKLSKTKPLFIGTRAFMKTARNEMLFVIYATQAQKEATLDTTILEQYKEFQDVFQKKNIDILSEHPQ